MNQRRVDFYLGAVGECLIAVGGRNDSGALSSVEVYFPAEDCWSYVAGLPRYEGTRVTGSSVSWGNVSDGWFSIKMCCRHEDVFSYMTLVATHLVKYTLWCIYQYFNMHNDMLL